MRLRKGIYVEKTFAQGIHIEFSVFTREFHTPANVLMCVVTRVVDLQLDVVESISGSTFCVELLNADFGFRDILPVLRKELSVITERPQAARFVGRRIALDLLQLIFYLRALERHESG